MCVDAVPKFAEACAKVVRANGGDAIVIQGDVIKEDQVTAAIACATTFGDVDTLVNGAVVQIRVGPLEMTVEQFRRQSDVMLAGAFGVAMELAPHSIRVNSLSPTATVSAEVIDMLQSGVRWIAPGSGHLPEAGPQGVPLGKRPSPVHYGREAMF